MILKLPPSDWEAFSESVHLAVFEKTKPKHFDRIDYALLIIDEKEDKPGGYVTVREHDHETVYWQFGGAFEWARNSTKTVSWYDECLRFQDKLSPRIITCIEASNTRMLKLALSRRFVIFGVRNWNGETNGELKRERNDAK